MDSLASPKVSVIVPVYNVEQYVAHCLDSLLAQTYRNLEIIAVNDGSRDGSQKILDRYAQEKGITVIVRENGGLSAARNSGMDVATGEWIMFCDADDAVHPELVERVVRIAKEKDVDFVRYEERNVSPEQMMSFDAPPSNMQVNVFNDPVAYYISNDLKPSACVILYRVKALNNLCFSAGIVFEDFDFNWRFFQTVNKGAHVKWAAYNYVQSANSITRSALTAKKAESIGFAIRNIAATYRRAKDRRLGHIRRTLFAISVKKQILKPYLQDYNQLSEETKLAVATVVSTLLRDGEVNYFGFSLQWWPLLIRLGRKTMNYVWPDGCESPVVFVSVVRNFEMYNRLVQNNPNNAVVEFVAFDNREDNKTIPVRYNSFLDTYDYSKPSWFVFCHEDFQFLEPLANKLPLMDKGAIYGAFGATFRSPGVGLQIDSNKDGSEMNFRGTPVRTPVTVDTIDCACLIVHSSLVERYGLRFDERLSYDLYTEDFGIAAKERFGIDTKVLPIRSHHYSYGDIQQRFHEQLKYLNEKYADASRVYVTTTAFAIGKAVALPRVNAILDTKDPKKRIPFRWLYYKKVSHKGRLIVKLFGLPIMNRRKYNPQDWHAERI